MSEKLSGRGWLRWQYSVSGSAAEQIEVDYDIDFDTSRCASGWAMPPTVHVRRTVNFVKAVTGKAIPEGHCELVSDNQHVHLQYVAGTGWFVTSGFER